MNNRIKELIEQATVEVRSHGAFGELERYSELDPEKFAELIVREAIQVCLSQRDPANLNYKPSERFAEAIKQHFRIY